MQLTPLQSRLVASLTGSIPVFALYWLLTIPNFAVAQELSFGSDVNVNVDAGLVLDQHLDELSELGPAYEPEFGLLDRSIIGRAADEAIPIKTNRLETSDLVPGSSRCYVLPRMDIYSNRNSEKRQTDSEEEQDGEDDETISEEERERRQASQRKTVYLSASTCVQPGWKSRSDQSRTPPQLKLLASTTREKACRSNPSTVDDDKWVDFEQGLATLSVQAENGPVYLTVAAPKIPDDFDGIYNVEVAVSLKSFVHDYDRGSQASRELLWMDSDSTAALLATGDILFLGSDSEKVMNRDPPYELYVENSAWPVFGGIQRSLCGMRQQALISANKDGNGRLGDLVRTKMSMLGKSPAQQFYFEGLNQSSSYNAVLIQVAGLSEEDGDSKRQEGVGEVPGSSGFMAFAPTNFTTNTGTTCKVITDLEFCSDNQHAVPGNGEIEGPALAKMYDEYAKKIYENFEKIMMQIPCEAPTTETYSLIRDCDDCREAYKRWLCTVTFPRCEDYSSTNFFTVPRNVGKPFPNGTRLPEDDLKTHSRRINNASRSSWIDEEIGPGPYKEILPCEELCYEVVQSCPAEIEFTCPRPGGIGFDGSYGQRINDVEAFVSCNYPGKPRTQVAAAGTLSQSTAVIGLGLISATWALL